MIEKVRQREYEVVVPEQRATLEHNIHVVQTKIIWTCTGLAGIDKNGVGFLAHFDTPKSTAVVPEIVAALKKAKVDFSTLELRIVTGWAGYWLPTNLPTRAILRRRLKEAGVFRNLPKTQRGTSRFLDTCGLIVDANLKTIEPNGIVHCCRREMGDYEPDNPRDYNTYRSSSKKKSKR